MNIKHFQPHNYNYVDYGGTQRIKSFIIIYCNVGTRAQTDEASSRLGDLAISSAFGECGDVGWGVWRRWVKSR